MDRTTRKDAHAAFERLIKAIGGRVATSYDDHGAYQLDWNASYGGGVIELISDESCGVSHPFGSERHKAAPFCDMVHFAMRAIEQVPSMAMENYRAGYSCGYSDAKNDKEMQDKKAAQLFFGTLL